MYHTQKSIQNVYSKKIEEVVYLRIDSDKLLDYTNQIEYVTESGILVGDFYKIGNRFIFVDNEYSILYECRNNQLIETERIAISNVNIKEEFECFSSIHFSLEETYSFIIINKSDLAFTHNIMMPTEINYLTQTGNGFYLRKKYGLGIYFISNEGLVKEFSVKCYNNDGYQDLHFLTIYQNQLICTVNQDRIIGIDANNGEVMWEVTEMQDVDGKRMNEFYLPDFTGIADGKIIFCSGVLYAEFELSAKIFSIKKMFAPINNLLSAELFISYSALKNELMYFTSENKKTKTWSTVGAFNIKTLEIVWTSDLDLPKTITLNKAPLIDENYLYVTDSANTLHIFEKE